MNQPLFSVIVPTYNRAGLIAETLESVFSQDYPHYEIIVVDDCSTDDTAAVLAPYILQKKIIYLRNEKNMERAHSRNAGMQSAKGDFLTFLDSDDFMYESCLSDAAEFIRANPDVKCFHNLFELVNNEKVPVAKYPSAPIGNRLKSIVNGNFLSCIGNFIHRDVYTKYYFDTFLDMSGIEDWEYWLRVLVDHEVSRLEKINNGVRHHDNRSVNTQNVKKMHNGCDYLINKIRNDRHLSSAYEPYLNRLEASLNLYLAVLANTNGMFEEASGYLKTALKRDFSIVFSTRFVKILRRAVLKLKIETS